jgi:hypothetical protein
LILDIDEYLPKETLQWCYQALQSLGFSVHLQSETVALDTVTQTQHFQAYIGLRTLIKQHEGFQLSPVLSLTLSPIGAYNWIIDKRIEELHSRAYSEGETRDESDAVELLTYADQNASDDEQGFQGRFMQPDADNDQEY